MKKLLSLLALGLVASLAQAQNAEAPKSVPAAPVTPKIGHETPASRSAVGSRRCARRIRRIANSDPKAPKLEFELSFTRIPG